MDEHNPWEPLAAYVATNVESHLQYMLVMQAVRARVVKTKATSPTNDVMAFTEMMLRDVRGDRLH